MAGLLKPAAAHTHDTSGIAASTVLAAADAGVDAVDVAMVAFSGGTSQPCLGSIVEALRHTERDTQLDIKAVRAISDYWEQVRAQDTAFESGLAARQPPMSIFTKCPVDNSQISRRKPAAWDWRHAGPTWRKPMPMPT